ncbi:MAG: hypothetical protein WC503_00900 [Candidatus Shapirobacteria bacterium]
MGYCMDQKDAQFYIPKRNYNKVIEAIKATANDTSKMGGGSYQGGRTISKWFGFVDMNYVNLGNLKEIFECWRWIIKEDVLGICGIEFMGEKAGDDKVLFQAIAPYVKSGSNIQMVGEDGAAWRWYFNGTDCVYQHGKVTYMRRYKS